MCLLNHPDEESSLQIIAKWTDTPGWAKLEGLHGFPPVVSGERVGNLSHGLSPHARVISLACGERGNKRNMLILCIFAELADVW